MDKIYRKISLEDFKNRFTNKNNNAFGTKWGEVVINDYLVTGGTLYKVADKIPLVENNFSGASENTRLRFGTMINLNTWINNVIDASEFFKLCMRGGEKKWVHYNCTFDESGTTAEEDFEFKGIYTEMPITTDDFETGDIIWITKEAEDVLKTFLADGETEQSLVLERIGELFEVVSAAETNEQAITGSGYAIINVMLTENCNEVGKFTKGATFWEPKKEYRGGEYALDPVSGIAYYLSGTTAYTESTEEFNENNTWVALEKEETLSSITAYTESRLDTLKRLRHSYDDYGAELPFIYNESNQMAELKYETGIVYNITTDGERFYGDTITDIRREVTGDTVDNLMTAITFSYVIGAELNAQGAAISGTGIEYCEGYEMSGETFTFRQNNRNVTVGYENIFFDKELPYFLPKDEDIEEGKRYAITKFASTVHQTNSGTPFVMQESMVGITDVKKSGIARVERGNAAAFEIHNILGECRTMEDLEKYRNDFFTIKDDEKQ